MCEFKQGFSLLVLASQSLHCILFTTSPSIHAFHIYDMQHRWCYKHPKRTVHNALHSGKQKKEKKKSGYKTNIQWVWNEKIGSMALMQRSARAIKTFIYHARKCCVYSIGNGLGFRVFNKFRHRNTWFDILSLEFNSDDSATCELKRKGEAGDPGKKQWATFN